MAVAAELLSFLHNYARELCLLTQSKPHRTSTETFSQCPKKHFTVPQTFSLANQVRGVVLIQSKFKFVDKEFLIKQCFGF